MFQAKSEHRTARRSRQGRVKRACACMCVHAAHVWPSILPTTNSGFPCLSDMCDKCMHAMRFETSWENLWAWALTAGMSLSTKRETDSQRPIVVSRVDNGRKAATGRRCSQRAGDINKKPGNLSQACHASEESIRCRPSSKRFDVHPISWSHDMRRD
jgi:hypothetical protein